MLAWLHPAAAATPRQGDRASLAVARGTRCLKPRCKASAVLAPHGAGVRPTPSPGPGLLVLQHRARSPAGGRCLTRPGLHTVKFTPVPRGSPTRRARRPPRPTGLSAAAPRLVTRTLCVVREGAHTFRVTHATAWAAAALALGAAPCLVPGVYVVQQSAPPGMFPGYTWSNRVRADSHHQHRGLAVDQLRARAFHAHACVSDLQWRLQLAARQAACSMFTVCASCRRLAGACTEEGPQLSLEAACQHSHPHPSASAMPPCTVSSCTVLSCSCD